MFVYIHFHFHCHWHRHWLRSTDYHRAQFNSIRFWFTHIQHMVYFYIYIWTAIIIFVFAATFKHFQWRVSIAKSFIDRRTFFLSFTHDGSFIFTIFVGLSSSLRMYVRFISRSKNALPTHLRYNLYILLANVRTFTKWRHFELPHCCLIPLLFSFSRGFSFAFFFPSVVCSMYFYLSKVNENECVFVYVFSVRPTINLFNHTFFEMLLCCRTHIESCWILFVLSKKIFDLSGCV